jgi:hypothetical protein
LLKLKSKVNDVTVFGELKTPTGRLSTGLLKSLPKVNDVTVSGRLSTRWLKKVPKVNEVTVFPRGRQIVN